MTTSPLTKILRIGLTGGIASGKSTVAQRFAELGVPVIDADEIARMVVEPGTPGLAAVVRRFGAEILAADGALDRRKLRGIVFADAAARRDLESILHPLIRAETNRRCAAAGGPYQILAIPLLVEGGGRAPIERILVVDADEETQIARLIARDHSSREQAKAILAAQASRTARLAAAHDVLLNDRDVATLRRSVDELHQRYLALAAAHSVDQ